MQLTSTESRIVRYIARYTTKNWNKKNSGPVWTVAMKQALVVLGHKLDYKVYAAPQAMLKSDWREWLYDLCWAVEKRSWQKLSLKLIAEIEWVTTNDSILEDFQKLTVGLSPYRLMITEYNEGNKKKLDKIVSLCKSICPPSRNFRYLMLGIPNKDSRNIAVYNWTR